MAVWQVCFSIIPKVQLSKHDILSEKVQNAEDIVCWNECHFEESSLDELSVVLKPENSWSGNLKVFGSFEQNCLELFYVENVLNEVTVRLDLRNLTLDILHAVIKFIKSNNAVILTSTASVINPEVSEIIAEIKESQAYRFISNSEVLLQQIEQGLY